MPAKYRLHRLKIDPGKKPELLEVFLNGLKGEVVSIVPEVTPLFLYFGARTKSIVIVEKIKGKK